MKLGIRDKRAPAVALREAELSVDKDVDVDVLGLPVCRYRDIALRDTRDASRACRKAIVGSGKAAAQLVSPEFPWTGLESRLIAFNGGFKDGAIRIFVHAFAPAPLAQPLVARVDLRQVNHADGSTGWKALVKIPKIGNGYGSLTVFQLDLKRFFFHRGGRKSFLSARCPDGRFRLSASRLEFRNEIETPRFASRIVFRGDLRVPCQPKR